MDLITVVSRNQLRSTTKPQSHIGKTGNTLAESVSVLEDLSERGKQEVDNAVDETHVQRHDNTDRALVEELDGAGDDLAEQLAERERGFIGGLDVRVSGFFAHLGCFALEENGGVRFAEEGEADEGCHSAQDGQQPEDPSPVRGLGEESSRNRADDGCDEHAQAENTHDTARVSQRSKH